MLKYLSLAAVSTLAPEPPLPMPDTPCGVPTGIVQAVQKQLKTVVNLSDANGGIFKPNRMWAAIVDRQGVLCSIHSSAEFAPSTDVWPGSRAIAIAKAGTANDFSNNGLAPLHREPLRPHTARRITLRPETTPIHSSRRISTSRNMHPATHPVASSPSAAASPCTAAARSSARSAVSGDSSCADHAIAFRMRLLAGYNTLPGGVAPDNTDNIIYAANGTPPTGFEQPHCFPSDLTPAQVETIPGH